MKKGFYQLFTGFFVVIAIVIVTLISISFYGVILEFMGFAGESEDNMRAAMLFKERLLLCHETTQLSEHKIEDCPAQGISGYRIIVQEIRGCEQREWTIGSFSSLRARYSYNLPFVQLDGTTCIARLLIEP